MTTTKDCVVQQEGKLVDKIFIIQKGDFVVTKHLVEEFPQKLTSGNNRQKTAGYTVGMLGPENLVGDDDVFDSVTYRTTVKCVSQKGELYVIMKEDFEKVRSF